MRIRQPVYRLNNLYWFKPKSGGWKTFNPNRFQNERFARLYPKRAAKQGHKEIELKSRKFGTSTGCCMFCLDNTGYCKDTEAVTMAHEQQKATEIFNNIVRPAWNNIGGPTLDEEKRRLIRPRNRYNNKTEIDLMDTMRSKYIVSNDLKGTTPDILHITEAGYFDDDERIKEALNALPPHGICVVESTAHGMGNWFEKTFNAAWAAMLEGVSFPWLPIFNPWFADPTNIVAVTEDMKLRFEDEARALQERYGLTDEQIFFWDQKKIDNDEDVYQFYPSEPEEAFLHSGRPVFNQKMIKALREKHARKPIRVTDDGILIFVEPNDNHTYGIGVDCAEGLENRDNSVADVVCKETGEQVAQIAGTISALEESDLARLVGILCRMYKNHSCVVERNNHGHTVISFLKNDPHVNLYRREVTDRITDQKTMVIGWDTNEKSKAFAIGSLRKALRDGACIPHAHKTYNELGVFVHGERGKMGAMKGEHDDRVIALSLAHVACERMVTMGSLSLADLGIF
ncbi:hypothetical protein [Blastopirellula marina]|uniref:Terminase large subunit gp17-like C-terminal domain-containing protein n=1 Tax=Blastopirellula marina TaxID=124 RepID=A0A2S8GSI0_9BACT|nr:hypothetical protein [Blastopirellula marina]PQO47386.1 hypothetical protein C5Y93_04910 [Blastopirellula marina]